MAILEVKNLTKIYGNDENKVVALDHVSFTVEKGEFIAIVGSSGSGKSTLLHLIGGVDKPTSGEVIVNGQNVYKKNENELAIFRRREVGLIYQFYNAFNRLFFFKIIAFKSLFIILFDFIQRFFFALFRYIVFGKL